MRRVVGVLGSACALAIACSAEAEVNNAPSPVGDAPVVEVGQVETTDGQVPNAEPAPIDAAEQTEAGGQPEEANAAVSETEDQIEEIVVTAQRRVESQSKTPVSVDVIGSEELANANIISEQDLRTATPGLQVRAGLNSNNLNYSLRGQSQDPYANTRPGVLPYFNEVQIGGAGGVSAPSSAFYDLQNVQVLKGPQGTLFGRSATGGAVLFTSQKPTDTFDGYASALGGNYDARKVEGAVGGPIDAAGILKMRAAGLYQERDGFQKNLFDGSTDGSFTRKGGRLSATLQPVESFTNELVFDYLKSEGSNTTAVLTGFMPYTGSPPPYVPVTLLYGGAESEQAISTGAGIIQSFTGVDAETARAQYVSFYSGRENQSLANILADQQARGPYKVDSDGPNLYESSNKILTNASTFEIDSGMRLKNIFGLADIDSVNGTDADGTAFAMSQSSGPRYIDQKSRQFSDELQLQGLAMDGRLEYIGGGYFSHETMTQVQQSHSFDILFGGADQTYNFKLTNNTWAAYSQGTYDLNGDGLGLTVGGRYTNESVEKRVLPADTSFGGEGLITDQSKTFTSFSWTVGLKDQLSPNLLAYLVSRRAYKAGGFNGTLPAEDGVDQFDAERVTDVELGTKFNGFIGEMPARANVAVYNNWIHNSQRAAFALLGSGPAGLTVNVPKGTTYGLELDGMIEPVQFLSVGGTFNYTHASYSSELTDLLGTGAPYDQVTDTPKFSGSVFADVTVPVKDTLTASLHGDVFAQGKTDTSPLSRNNYGTVIDGYELVNLRLGLSQKERGWSIYANVKNVTDKTYYVGGQATGEVYQLNLLVPGDRRTFTIEVRQNF